MFYDHIPAQVRWSDGGTAQNIHFNVFVLVVHSIHHETFEM